MSQSVSPKSSGCEELEASGVLSGAVFSGAVLSASVLTGTVSSGFDFSYTGFSIVISLVFSALSD